MYTIQTFRTDSEFWDLTEEDFKGFDAYMAAEYGSDWQKKPMNDEMNCHARYYLYDHHDVDEEVTGEGGEFLVTKD